jgi:hypothetical protein
VGQLSTVNPQLPDAQPSKVVFPLLLEIELNFENSFLFSFESQAGQ